MRKSFGCFAGAWWNAGRVGRRGLLRYIFKTRAAAEKKFVISEILAVCVFSLKFSSNGFWDNNSACLREFPLVASGNFFGLFCRRHVDVTRRRLTIREVVRLASKN